MTDGCSRYGRATFAAGCFWDIEAAFRRVDGVVETVAGYTGGTISDPTYEQVESGTTGHVQAVGLIFDPSVVTYEQLIEIFLDIHDPSQSGGQGDYSGPQYSSVIFYHDAGQEAAAEKALDRIKCSGQYDSRPVVTQIRPATEFWPAEESHQQFYEKCGQGHGVSRQIME